jgi:putative PIN family toxin of toxin-antitoxin system
MVDSNIIISAALFPNSNVARIFEHITENHVLVLCEYTINEVERVFSEKFPHKINDLNIFMAKTKYTLVNFDMQDATKYPAIRDIDDVPVLANAIEAKVDVLLTGDKDFDEILIDKPKIMNPKNYIHNYMQN